LKRPRLVTGTHSVVNRGVGDVHAVRDRGFIGKGVPMIDLRPTERTRTADGGGGDGGRPYDRASDFNDRRRESMETGSRLQTDELSVACTSVGR